MNIVNFYNFILQNPKYVIDGIVFYFNSEKNYLSQYACYTYDNHWIINDQLATEKMCFQLLKICRKRHIKQTIINQLELYKVDYFLLLKQLVNQHLIHDLLFIMVNFL